MTYSPHVMYARQHALLDPEVAADTHITVLGCGTVGSNAAVQLARAGYGHFTLWDHDTIELANIPSQAFSISDLGKLKVHATEDAVRAVNPTSSVSVHAEKFVPGMTLDTDVVVCAVDSMETRVGVFDDSFAKPFPMGGLFLDFRMGGFIMMAYAVPKNDARRYEQYRTTLYPSSEAAQAPCGTKTFAPVGALSGAIATQLVSKYVTDQSQPYLTQIDLDAMVMSVAGRPAEVSA